MGNNCGPSLNTGLFCWAAAVNEMKNIVKRTVTDHNPRFTMLRYPDKPLIRSIIVAIIGIRHERSFREAFTVIPLNR
jgi:hypothetical protein